MPPSLPAWPVVVAVVVSRDQAQPPFQIPDSILHTGTLRPILSRIASSPSFVYPTHATHLTSPYQSSSHLPPPTPSDHSCNHFSFSPRLLPIHLLPFLPFCFRRCSFDTVSPAWVCLYEAELVHPSTQPSALLAWCRDSFPASPHHHQKPERSSRASGSLSCHPITSMSSSWNLLPQ